LERDFKGVWIPADVWLDTRLNALDKIILAEIDSLDTRGRGCCASNKYIADFCQCSESKVSHSITKLIEAGYIFQRAFDGRQRVLKSRLLRYEPIEQEPQQPQKAAQRKNYGEEYKAIIEYLNAATGAKYRASSKATQAHINARFKEGYSVEDFKAVIDKKCAEWKGTKFEQYLCPETLFGTKFEKYLNAPTPTTKTTQPKNEYKQGVDFF